MSVRPTRKAILVAALAAGLLAAGCHKRSEEGPPSADLPENVATTPAPDAVEAPPAANMAETNASIAELPKPPKPKAWPAPEIPADQQTQDDADATGMTAHVSPDSGSADTSGGNAQ